MKILEGGSHFQNIQMPTQKLRDQSFTSLKKINPIEKQNQCKFSLLNGTLMEHFLQENVSLRYLLKAKPPVYFIMEIYRQ